jgi:hypothetical protein
MFNYEYFMIKWFEIQVEDYWRDSNNRTWNISRNNWRQNRTGTTMGLYMHDSTKLDNKCPIYIWRVHVERSKLVWSCFLSRRYGLSYRAFVRTFTAVMMGSHLKLNKINNNLIAIKQHGVFRKKKIRSDNCSLYMHILITHPMFNIDIFQKYNDWIR